MKKNVLVDRLTEILCCLRENMDQDIETIKLVQALIKDIENDG